MNLSLIYHLDALIYHRTDMGGAATICYRSGMHLLLIFAFVRNFLSLVALSIDNLSINSWNLPIIYQFPWECLLSSRQDNRPIIVRQNEIIVRFSASLCLCGSVRKYKKD
jgi:hypothetical protein